MQQTIETKIAQAWTAAWNEGNYDPLRDLLAPEFVRESKGSERTVDAEGFIKQIHEVRQALPDSTTKIERVLARGDEIGLFWTTDGTFTQPLGNVPPTGRQVTTSGATLSTIKDGKIVYEQATWNMTALLADLGLPSLASAFEEMGPDAGAGTEARANE